MNDDASGSESRYRAPALEKGLQILELLARATTSLTMSQLSERLGRSKGEIFRMVQVLELLGYIVRRPGEEGYALTNKLFSLGMEQPPVRGLFEAAMPLMQNLAHKTQQSCHLAVPSREQIVVIARVDSPDEVGFAVRLGHRRPLHQSTSGRVLFAFQPPSIQKEWLEQLKEAYPDLDEAQFIADTQAIAKRGHALERSAFVSGITDVSSPIMIRKVPMAALTVPFVEKTDSPLRLEEVSSDLQRAAEDIGRALEFGHNAGGTPTGPISGKPSVSKAPNRRNNSTG
jgi:DNA-binding IclR family transcriptional regulator